MRKRKRQQTLLSVSLVILFILAATFLIRDYFTKKIEGESQSAYLVIMGQAIGHGTEGFVSMCQEGTHKIGEGIGKLSDGVKGLWNDAFGSKDDLDEIIDSTEGNALEVTFDFEDNGEMLAGDNSQISMSKVIDDTMTIVTNSSGARYLAFTPGADATGLDIVRYLVIPKESSGISFRPMQDVVYAISETNLFLDATMKTTSYFPVYQGKSFTRTGASSNGVYQLVDSNKQIVYADGSKFTRYKEDTDYDEEIILPQERVELEMKVILQNPELPNGCEVTALTILLDYLGYRVDKCILADDYLPKAPLGKANFYEEYVGNPREESGLGCYADAIVTTANKFLQSRKSNYCARNYTGCSFNEVIHQLDEGNPCIVWVSSFMEEEPRLTTKWLVDGESLTWKSNLHCLVVSGYDGVNRTVLTYDPLYGQKEYDLDLFVKRFKQYYSQIVIITYK